MNGLRGGGRLFSHRLRAACLLLRQFCGHAALSGADQIFCCRYWANACALLDTLPLLKMTLITQWTRIFVILIVPLLCSRCCLCVGLQRGATGAWEDRFTWRFPCCSLLHSAPQHDSPSPLYVVWLGSGFGSALPRAL